MRRVGGRCSLRALAALSRCWRIDTLIKPLKFEIPMIDIAWFPLKFTAMSHASERRGHEASLLAAEGS